MLFVFLGLRDQRLSHAVNVALSHPSASDLSFTHLDGTKATVDELNEACGMLSLFGEQRKVYLDNAPSSGTRSKHLVEWLAAFVTTQRSDPSANTCDLAVSVYLDLSDGRTASRATKFGGLKASGARIQRFDPLRGDAAVRYAQSIANNLNVQLSAPAATRLVELVTSHAGLIESEVSKLAAFCGFSGEITEEDVDAASATIGEHSRWDYINAVADLRADDALSILHDMLSLQTPHHLILNDITTSLRQIASARQIIVEGGNEHDVKQAAGVPPSRARTLTRQARRMSDGLIGAMYAEAVRTDAALKSTGGNKDALLEILTARLSSRPQASSG